MVISKTCLPGKIICKKTFCKTAVTIPWTDFQINSRRPHNGHSNTRITELPGSRCGIQPEQKKHQHAGLILPWVFWSSFFSTSLAMALIQKSYCQATFYLRVAKIVSAEASRNPSCKLWPTIVYMMTKNALATWSTEWNLLCSSSPVSYFWGEARRYALRKLHSENLRDKFYNYSIPGKGIYEDTDKLK